MSVVCGRCNEKEAVLECADCVGSKRRGELLPLCDACNVLIHVGFLSEHQVVSVEVKQQKKLFEDQLEKFKSCGKHLQLKLNEVYYARQDIEQRSQYNQQVVSQALQAVWQALKQKEKELTTPLKESSKKEAALLSECEKRISQATSEFKSLSTDAQKLLQGNSLEFAQQYEGLKKKLEEFEIGDVGSSFPSLGPPARLDVTGLLQNIKELGLRSLDTGEIPTSDAPSKDEGGEVEKDPSLLGAQEKKMPELQSPKEGDTLQVYVESRLDPRSHFWVSRNLSEDAANVYENLSFRIRQDIVQNPLSQVDIEEGILCCGQFQEDHRWYRGRVEQLRKDKGLARIRWLDYAHDNEVPLAAVQPLKEEFQTLPFQALECSLFEDLDEDLPHQARWEFSDHTANVLLDCAILKKVSSALDGKSHVYLVELKNPDKEVDIKGAVVQKAEEATSKKDTIMCRDIRYMKDYVPPGGKSAAAKKEPTPEKAKEKDIKEAKKESQEDKSVDESKDAEKEDETEESKEGKVMDRVTDAAERSTEPAGGDSVAGQKGRDEGHGGSETRQADADSMGEARQEGDSGRNHKMGQESEKEMIVSQRGEGSDDQAGPAGAGEEPGTVTSTDLQTDKLTSVDSIRDSKREQAVSAEGSVNGLSRSSPGQQEDPRNSTSKTEVSNASLPLSGQTSSPTDQKPPRDEPDEQQHKPHPKKPGAADVGAYLLEPGDEDDEEGADHHLIELLASQGDRAMAHSPDNAFGDRSPWLGSSYPYCSAGYSMAPGIFGGVQHPPEALGLNPVVPSMDSHYVDNGSIDMVETPKPDQGSFTGDGFKIVVGSSFSVYVATPLSDNGRFWASRLRGPAQESQLRRLMHDISLPSEPLTLERLKEIKVVCVQTQSGQWCRGRVEGFVDEKVQVRYVDFGQAEVVEEHRIKTLPVADQLFPYQAMELSIATRQQTHFSEQAKNAFLRYTQGRLLTAKVVATEPKSVYVTLSCMGDNQLSYDISSAILSINSEAVPSGAEERPAGNSRWGSRDEQNGRPVSEEYRLLEASDARYDQQYEGRSHDRGSGDRCYVCNNFGHLSYDCPNRRTDNRERGDRRNKGSGASKKNWGRRNRKY
ncbi:uncharacterized protein LOC110981619 isoform X2 [Acanthaster planci]|uniref:Uncharacterized protein LOC110981619 isoform X2 n=1 Tax=Acanthaster planci TaxID=133434 RepID=A0A8B7YQT0_ACAPL|nr:uncharacterized protein LOC110981619 isoform X2 [Acanthaster planci]